MIAKKKKPGPLPTNGETKPFTLRLPLTLYRKLQVLASRNRRSKSQEAIVAIERGVAE